MSTSVRQSQSLSEITCVVHEGISAVEALAPQWIDLWERSSCNIPFCHADWVTPYVTAFEPGARVVLLAAYRADQLLAVLPLVRESIRHRGLPVRRLRTLTNSHGSRADVLRMPGPDGDAGFGAVWNRLVSLPHWDIADLEVLPSHTANSVKAAADRDGYDILADEKSSVIVPFDTCRENPLKWLSGMSSHSRHELRRHRRKLEGAVDDKPITLVRTDASDLALMNAFYRIEASGWKGEQGTGTAIACAENTKSFYDEIAERFTRRGLFELYALTVGGEPIAMLYAIRAHQRMSLLKIGYLNKYESSAPGQLMFDEVFHVLWDRGISEGDFGPDGDYKRRWTQNLVPRVSCRIFNSNFYGKALHALETQVKPAVKAIFAASSEQA